MSHLSRRQSSQGPQQHPGGFHGGQPNPNRRCLDLLQSFYSAGVRKETPLAEQPSGIWCEGVLIHTSHTLTSEGAAAVHMESVSKSRTFTLTNFRDSGKHVPIKRFLFIYRTGDSV